MKLNELNKYYTFHLTSYIDVGPLLKAPYGTAYIRDENGVFQEEPFEPLEE